MSLPDKKGRTVLNIIDKNPNYPHYQEISAIFQGIESKKGRIKPTFDSINDIILNEGDENNLKSEKSTILPNSTTQKDSYLASSSKKYQLSSSSKKKKFDDEKDEQKSQESSLKQLSEKEISKELQKEINNSDLKEVKKLLEKGASPSRKNNNFTPIRNALANNDQEMLGLLISYGADLNLHFGRSIKNKALLQIYQDIKSEILPKSKTSHSCKSNSNLYQFKQFDEKALEALKEKYPDQQDVIYDFLSNILIRKDESKLIEKISDEVVNITIAEMMSKGRSSVVDKICQKWDKFPKEKTKPQSANILQEGKENDRSK